MEHPKHKTNTMRYLTTGQVAKACQVSVVAVKKWIRDGKLKGFQTPGGHFRIPDEDFHRFQASYGFSVEAIEPARILVVDDDREMVDVLLDALAAVEPALKLEAAFNGYEGVLKVGTFRPHVLVLDLRMPGLDGFEVCRRIKADPATQATKVLTITAYADDSAREQALRCGADAFLAKPFAVQELVAQVEDLLE